MNNYDLILYSIIICHLTIWIIVLLSGIINKNINVFILTILLPIIYIVQILSKTHPFTTFEILFIKNNINKLSFKSSSSQNIITNADDVMDITHFSEIHNIPLDECVEYFNILENYKKHINDILQIPNIYEKYINKYFKDSFRPPFGAQGSLIFCYIINVYIYFLKK